MIQMFYRAVMPFDAILVLKVGFHVLLELCKFSFNLQEVTLFGCKGGSSDAHFLLSHQLNIQIRVSWVIMMWHLSLSCREKEFKGLLDTRDELWRSTPEGIIQL